MECPDWVTAPEWAHLSPVLGSGPAAHDALDDLRAATETWAPVRRAQLIERFVGRAGSGAPLPAAFILALTDLLEPHDE